MTIDPYELLGLTLGPKGSSQEDARRAYYRLALLVHPDRGGSADDMRVLHQAYVSVREEQKVAEAGRTQGEARSIEAEPGVEAELPTWAQVMEVVEEEGSAMSKLTREFNANMFSQDMTGGVLIPASPLGGYGDWMAPTSTASCVYDPTPPLTPMPAGSDQHTPGEYGAFGPAPMVVYVEPSAARIGWGMHTHTTTLRPCDPMLEPEGRQPTFGGDPEPDFSVSEAPLRMLDYRLAFSDPPPVPPLEEHARGRPMTLEALCAERSLQMRILASVPSFAEIQG